MKKTISIVFLLISISGFAQQEPLTSMFWNNYSVVNPANSGFEYKHFATVQGRNQWVGYEGHPKMGWINYDFKIEAINSGVGLNYLYDEIGNISTNKLQFNYNYQHSFSEEHRLGAGISYAYQKQDMADQWQSGQGIYIDALVPGSSTSSTYNISIGVLYRLKDLRFGFSIVNLTERTYKHSGTHWQFEYPLYRTYYLLSTYAINVSKSFELKPGIFYKYDLTAHALDLNVRATLKDKYWIGVTLRTAFGQDFGFMGGINLWAKLKLGYSFELHNRSFNDGSRGGSHEVFITFAVE